MLKKFLILFGVIGLGYLMFLNFPYVDESVSDARVVLPEANEEMIDLVWWEEEDFCGKEGPFLLELREEAKSVRKGGKYWVKNAKEGKEWSVLLPIQAEAGCLRSEWKSEGGWSEFESALACVQAGVQATLVQNLGDWCGGHMRYWFVPEGGGETELMFEVKTF